MLLATDLDGTFLAGDPESRLKLYQLISAHPDIQLAFVTGRGLESVSPLLSDPTIPEPDYIICDVGCTVLSLGCAIVWSLALERPFTGGTSVPHAVLAAYRMCGRRA